MMLQLKYTYNYIIPNSYIKNEKSYGITHSTKSFQLQLRQRCNKLNLSDCHVHNRYNGLNLSDCQFNIVDNRMIEKDASKNDQQ